MRAIDRVSKNEIPVRIAAARRKRVRIFSPDDHVRLAELPSRGECRFCRKVRCTAFEHALVHPRLESGDLFVGQSQLVRKFQFAWVGQPRRHDALVGDKSNLARVRFYIGISEQREMPCFAGMMAKRAIVKNNRRHITVESDLPRRRRRLWIGLASRSRMPRCKANRGQSEQRDKSRKGLRSARHSRSEI